MLIYVNNPGSFWVQPAEKTYAQDFQRLMGLIKNQVENSAPLQNPKVKQNIPATALWTSKKNPNKQFAKVSPQKIENKLPRLSALCCNVYGRLAQTTDGAATTVALHVLCSPA